MLEGSGSSAPQLARFILGSIADLQRKAPTRFSGDPLSFSWAENSSEKMRSADFFDRDRTRPRWALIYPLTLLLLQLLVLIVAQFGPQKIQPLPLKLSAAELAKRELFGQ